MEAPRDRADMFFGGGAEEAFSPGAPGWLGWVGQGRRSEASVGGWVV